MGPYQEVIFKEEMISLDIPEEGIVVNNGWTITPRTYPGVGLVRNFLLYFQWQVNANLFIQSHCHCLNDIIFRSKNTR